MKRLTVTLPDEIATRLDEEHRRRAVPASAIIREAVEHYLGSSETSEPLGIIGLGASGEHDVSERIEEILLNEWTASIAADRDAELNCADSVRNGSNVRRTA